MKYTLELPWPSKSLSPNGRAHWAVKARDAKTHKNMAFAVTRIEVGKPEGWKAVKIHWTFHPKTAHGVDDDNAEAMCKAYRDGIAQALGVDDKHFVSTKEVSTPIKGGKVIVTIEEVK